MPSSYKIQPEDRQYIEEMRKTPVGHHSPGLNRVLTLLRGEPTAGKEVLVIEEPHKKWRLGICSGERGTPIRMTKKVFDDLEEAEWYVFKRRWKKHTGETIR